MNDAPAAISSRSSSGAVMWTCNTSFCARHAQVQNARCFRSTLGGSHLARIWLAVAACAPSVFHGTLTADHHLAAGLLHQPLLRVPSWTDNEADEVHFRVLFAGHEDFFLRTRDGVRRAEITERATPGGRAHLELLRGDELLRRPVQRVEFLWSASGPVSGHGQSADGGTQRESSAPGTSR